MKKYCLAITHPNIAKLWHPTKNGNLTPYEVTHGSNIKVWWKCPIAEDHEWKAVIASIRSDNTGCSCCAGKTVVPSNCLATTHPDITKQWHFTKNSLLPHEVTYGSHKKVWWKCPLFNDHEWEDSINYRVSLNTGCKCCAGFKIVSSNCIKTLYPDLASEWHPTKNNTLTPNDIGVGTRRHGQIWWLGNCGHEWQAYISDRIQGNCCPICNFSNGENIIEKYLNLQKIKHEHQYRFPSCKNIKSLPFDFILFHETQLKLIEFHGRHHYEFVKFFHKNDKGFTKIKIRDTIKKEWCVKNNIPLLVIPYWEINNIDNLINVFVK
jgi:hypothetical protein